MGTKRKPPGGSTVTRVPRKRTPDANRSPKTRIATTAPVSKNVWTADDVTQLLVNPIGGLWANWTQAFNRSELSGDRDRMIAVTRILRATAAAFRAGAKGEPALEKLGEIAGRYLRRNDRDVIASPVDQSKRLMQRFANALEQVRRSAQHCSLDGGRRETATAHASLLEELSERLPDQFLDSLEHGFAFSDVKAKLPANFLSRRPEVESAVRHALEKFDPVADNAEDAAERLTLAALRAVGHPKPRSFFDAARKSERRTQRE